MGAGRLDGLAGRLHRQLVRRSVPHGLLGPRLLLPGPPATRPVHRALWWNGLPSLPRPAFVALEVALWLRWIGWRAWRASWAVAGRLAQEEGVAGRPAFGRLLRLALAWSIPPGQAVRLGLHLPTAAGRRDPALDHVFDHEADAWHRACNAGAGDAAAGALLRDKHAFAEAAARAGLPAVDDEQVLARGLSIAFAAAAGSRASIFCKPRHGSGGRDAFAAWQQGGGWRGRWLAGGALDGPAALDAALARLLAADDVLLQPLLRDAPALAAWHAIADGARGGGGVGDAATIRVVTWRDDGGQVRCAAAWLELRGAAGAGWLSCPLDVADGRPRAPDATGGAQAARTAAAALARAFSADARLADWAAIDAGSRAAHALLGGLWAVAWDWVCTERGPRLLEGNENWSLLALQREIGGLLAPATLDGPWRRRVP